MEVKGLTGERLVTRWCSASATTKIHRVRQFNLLLLLRFWKLETVNTVKPLSTYAMFLSPMHPAPDYLYSLTVPYTFRSGFIRVLYVLEVSLAIWHESQAAFRKVDINEVQVQHY